MAHENTSGSAYSDLQDDLATLKDDLANLRDDLGELMKSFVSAGRTRVGDIRERMQGEVKSRIDQIGQRQSKAMTSVQQQIEAHPSVVIGAAFGLGILLGVMMKKS